MKHSTDSLIFTDKPNRPAHADEQRIVNLQRISSCAAFAVIDRLQCTKTSETLTSGTSIELIRRRTIRDDQLQRLAKSSGSDIHGISGRTNDGVGILGVGDFSVRDVAAPAPADNEGSSEGDVSGLLLLLKIRTLAPEKSALEPECWWRCLHP